MSWNREKYEWEFERLVEDYLRDIEEANSQGRLLPSCEIDNLGCCRRQNLVRWDEDLLGQTRLARSHHDARWLDIAAWEACVIHSRSPNN